METYDVVLDALGDRTRRTVLERLRSGPLPVVEIARGLPVSRPAVSQHLKVLKDAGLVVDRQEGNRRYYAIDPSGLALLRAYVEAFWQGALLHFAQAAEADLPE
jgi:DNA-binding transcriptional ArsR family regulator